MPPVPLPRGKPTPAAQAGKPDPGLPPRPAPAALRPPLRPALSIPIAIKFAVAISVLVLLIMTWQIFTALRVAVESQDAAINESGIKDVSALASLLDPAWLAGGATRRLEDELRLYCSSTGSLGVLNAVVYSVTGEALATGVPGQQSFKVSQEHSRVAFPRAEEAGVEIHELQYDLQPVRRFSKAIRARRGEGEEVVGRVEVLLSARRIRESRDAILDRMMTVSAASAGAAALLSFFLAAFLTYPVRTLARDLRQVSLGNFDHQSSVRSGDEIGDLARTFNHMTSNLRQAQEARVAQKAMEHELALATRIQSRLLPSSIPRVKGLDIGAYYLSAKEVGGDYYDFLRIDDDHLGVVVADVSGKGVPGSLVMTMTRSLLRMAAAGQHSPLETIRQVNLTLAADLNPGMFVTLLYLVVDIPTLRVRLVRAGHNAPLLYVAQRKKLVPLSPRGIALGLDRQSDLFARELELQQFTLAPGDFIVAYTDGIVEGKDPQAQCYSEERFARVLQEAADRSAQDIVARVMADLDVHRRGAEQSDDITLLVLKSLPPLIARPGRAG